MSARVLERVTSRRRRSRANGAPRYAELLYTITGETDEDAVEDALLATAPEIYNGLPQYEVELEPVTEDLWTAVVTYQPASSTSSPPDEIGTSRESFEITSESRQITHSLATVSAYDTGGRIKGSLYGGAINVQIEDGKPVVKGTEIQFPVYGFTVNEIRAAAFVTQAHRETFRDLVGTYNQSTFRGFAEGEVLFIGLTGTQRSDDAWDLSYHFAVSPTGRVSYPDLGALIEKFGWDYLWVQSEETIIPPVGSKPAYLGTRVIAAFVERVYAPSDFGRLEML